MTQRRKQGSQAREQSRRNSRNVRGSAKRGGQFNPNFFQEDVGAVEQCKYCYGTFWKLEQSRQQYCAPKTERKLFMFRRLALIDMVWNLLRWRGVLRGQVVAMVDKFHEAVLRAVRALGWLFDERQKKFIYAERKTA
jgi:hypothetical protein